MRQGNREAPDPEERRSRQKKKAFSLAGGRDSEREIQKETI